MDGESGLSRSLKGCFGRKWRNFGQYKLGLGLETLKYVQSGFWRRVLVLLGLGAVCRN